MKITKISKKSQWLDLLFAYGWAIMLIALSLLSFLYFGLLREGNIVDAACEFPAGLSCIDAPKANATLSAIRFRLVNTLGFSITEINATSKGDANCKSLNTSSPVAADTTVVVITLLNCSIEEAIKFEDDVTITFVNAETKQRLQKIGRIIGRAE
ncbi:hypothetical protein HZA96_00565 [Candidatus Woesearchaeota archaeon]|nr:hypothetical protein [Candidatus Woesearchaeota archaeon]